MISTNRPIGPLSLLPDRGSPTLIRLVGSYRTAHIKGKVGIRARVTRFNGATVPTDRVNLNRSKAVLPATGCPTNLTIVSAAPLDFISTALDAYYTVAPASTLLLRRNREKGEEAYPDLRLHRKVHPRS